MSFGARESYCSGFSCCGAQATERRLSCRARAQLPRGMWDLLKPGTKPISPALAGGVLTTGPPGRSIESGLRFGWPSWGAGLGVSLGETKEGGIEAAQAVRFSSAVKRHPLNPRVAHHSGRQALHWVQGSA